MIPTLVRTATYGNTGVATFAENTAGNILFAAFVVYGGTSPYSFPSTCTDEAGNVYHLLANGAIGSPITAFGVYVCNSCVTSSSNNVTSPISGTVSTFAMASEFEGPGTVVVGGSTIGQGTSSLSLTGVPSTAMALGVSMSIGGTSEAAPGVVALYTGEPTGFQYDASIPTPSYTQNFSFSGGSGSAAYLVTVIVTLSPSPLIVKKFVNADGTPIANGKVLMRLSQDGSVGDEQIQSNFTTLVLDNTGTVVGSPVFWQNSAINPPGTYYIQKVFSASGQRVSGPSVVIV